jgi:ATP-dependent RNA helicase RhlE
MKFTELGLAEPIVRAVADKGYTDATPIQSQSIPVALSGQDVLGCAQTGTGKTCAFALPILHNLSSHQEQSKKGRHKDRQGRPPRALVLCPTRELATQIFESFVAYGRNLHLRHAVVFGGVNQRKQVQALRAGVDVLVATPGRLLDLINQGHIDLSQIETLVLDEADRMLDMGFIHDIRKVIGMIPEDRQTLFFSATVSKEIRALADAILQNPVTVETAPESSTAELITQRVYFTDRSNKAVLLERILSEDEVGRVLVFTKTKHGADKLVKFLQKSDISSEAIHGNKTQNARTRTMSRFKKGKTQVLVATDIASRGIDVDEITHVVNFDMPIDPETYVHRIGRTARAGASGIAISLCGSEEIGIYRAIERRTKITLPIGEDHEDLTIPPPQPRDSFKKKQHRGTRKQSQSKRFDGSNHSGASTKKKRRGKPQPKGVSDAKPSKKSSERATRKPSGKHQNGSNPSKFKGRVKKSSLGPSKRGSGTTRKLTRTA